MNARTICLDLGLALAAGVAVAQPEVEWERTFSLENPDYNQVRCLVECPDGGFAIGGTIDEKFLLIRLNDAGDSIWTRVFGDGGESLRELVCTDDGGFALIGLTWTLGAGSTDILLVRVNSEGDSLWSMTYGSNREERFSTFIQTNDGGYGILGELYLNGGGIRSWLIRADESGNQIWTRSFEEIYLKDIIETDQGGFAMIGSSNNSGPVHFEVTDSEGNTIVSNDYGISGLDYSKHITKTAGQGFILSGQHHRSYHDGEHDDIFLLGLNHDGDSLWYRQYGEYSHEELHTIVPSGDGGIAFDYDDDQSNVNLARTDRNGELLWELNYDGQIDTSFSSRFSFDMIRTMDNAYAILARANYNNGDYMKFSVFKTTPDPISVRDSRSTLNPLTFNLFPAYPNPFNASVTIPFAVEAQGLAPLQLAVFDPLGRRIADLIPDGGLGGSTRASGPHSVIWDANGCPGGIYFVRLKSGSLSATQSVTLIK